MNGLIEGERMKSKDKTFIAIRIDPDVKHRLKIRAAEVKTSVSCLIEKMILKYLEKK